MSPPQHPILADQSHPIQFLIYYLPYFILAKDIIPSSPSPQTLSPQETFYTNFHRCLEPEGDLFPMLLSDRNTLVAEWAEKNASNTSISIFFKKTTPALSQAAKTQYQQFCYCYDHCSIDKDFNPFSDNTAFWLWSENRSWQLENFHEYINIIQPKFNDLYLGYGLERMRRELALDPSKENRAVFQNIINQVTKYSLKRRKRKGKSGYALQLKLIADFIKFYEIRKREGSGKPFVLWRAELDLVPRRNRGREVAVRATWSLISLLEDQWKKLNFDGLFYMSCLDKYIRYKKASIKSTKSDH